MITIKKVLVATDFSTASETALEYGRAFVRSFGGTLLVLHVVENVFMRSASSEFGAADLGAVMEDLEASARRQLEAAVRDDDRRELGARPVLLTATSAAAAIVTYARDERVDLIIMGTHGRGALSQLLMGSVAEKVVRTAPCPVLTVRHPEHEFVVPDALVRVARA
jgi:nucleotide-binding universal stress UspA family protein